MKRLLLIALPLLLLAGCATTPYIPEGAYTLELESLSEHQMQTRRFENVSEETLLSASADVFLDAGFSVDEANSQIGIIAGSKKRYASTDEQRAVGFIAPLFGIEVTAEHSQDIYTSMLVRPVTNEKGEIVPNSFSVHILFQSTVLVSPAHVSCNPIGFLLGSISCQTTQDRYEFRTLKDPVVYQEFFEGLSKAIFLEKEGV